MVDVKLYLLGNLGLFLYSFSNLVEDWVLKALFRCWPEEWVYLDQRLQHFQHLWVTVRELFLVVYHFSGTCLHGFHVLRSVICGDKADVLRSVMASLLNDDSHLVMVTYHIALVDRVSLLSKRRKWEARVTLEKH